MDRELLLERALEELEIAQEAIKEYEKNQNITTLRKAYEAINLTRSFVGTEIKEAKASSSNY